MSDPPTSFPPGAIAVGPVSRIPPAPAGASQAVEGPVSRLRAEVQAAGDRSRQARLLYEIGEVEERAGDEPAAARDYLAAFNADPTFREPLEGLVRLLERRRSVRNLGKLIDALVRAALTPEEKARALIMKAAYAEDVSTDLEVARKATVEATEASKEGPEAALAWIMLEMQATRLGDAELRTQALTQRSQRTTDPTWRALLLLDLGRLAAAAGNVDGALGLLEEARNLRSGASFAATQAAARLIRSEPGAHGSDEAKQRLRAYAGVLEAQAEIIREARADEAKGDSLGVPIWIRDTTHMVDSWLRAAEARRLAGEIGVAATVLDRALAELGSTSTDSAGLVETALVNQRLRIAELMGDSALAAELAQKRIANEKDGGVAAALAMRVAEHAAGNGDAIRALDALSLAVAKDPASIPARALQLDLLADGGEPSQFASQLEAFAEHLENEEARGRAFLLAAFVWGTQAADVPGAKAALSQAAMYGVPPGTVARLARAMASVQGDLAWHEEATRRLLSSGAAETEVRSLWFELVRSKLNRGDAEGVAKALKEFGASEGGAWLARAIEAFVRGAVPDERGRAALDELADTERADEPTRAVSFIAALRKNKAGEGPAAKERLRKILVADPSNLLVALYLAELERAGGDRAAAAEVLAATASRTEDGQLATALNLEAGFERWLSGDRASAVALFATAAESAPVAAQNVVAWASRAQAGESVEARRTALDRALDAGEDQAILGIQRVATELGGGDPDQAAEALASLENGADASLLNAASLARLAWSQGAANWDALRGSIVRLGSLGEKAQLIAAAEQLRLVRHGDPEGRVEAARRWFDIGGGMPAALEWVAASLDQPEEEQAARRKIAELLPPEGREALLASAAMLDMAAHLDAEKVHFVEGESIPVRLANLELARPGGDPRRRAKALVALDNALGDDVQIDAFALAGWSLLASGDVANALKAFSQATQARADDLCSWEGLRTAAEALGDKVKRAEAAEELGALCADARRGAAFWEEAALIWLDLGEGERGEVALDRSFTRDPTRLVAFDKLFRRIRERKEGEKLLDMIERRLDVSEDPKEMVKLYWERSRVLREGGDLAGALIALENVTMVEPDHVGALALKGEIFIRRGEYEAAAESLGRLSGVDTAPAKNRMTAGIAAVDLYENKLDRFDKAVEILLALHRAKLSSLPVRERLARAAARTGSWQEAATILEELMHERSESAGRAEAAALAMAIRRDRLNDAQGAKDAVIKVLEETPGNGDAIDLLLTIEVDPETRSTLLQKARAGLVAKLDKDSSAGADARRLATVAHLLHDAALEQICLSAATALGANDGEGQLAFAQLTQSKPRLPQIALRDGDMKTLLAQGDDGPLTQLFVTLGPTIADALGPSLVALGVTKKDKIDPRAGLALRNEVAAWAGAFGIREFDLYVGGKDPTAVQGVPGEPPAIVVGAGVNAPLPSSIRGRVARELLAISRGTTVLRSRDGTTVAAIVVAACKLAEVPIQAPPYAVLAEVEKLLSKALARKTRKLLQEICQRVVSSRADARVWATRAISSQDRVQALGAGDVTVVLAEVLGVTPDKVPALAKDDRALELLRFVLSPAYLELRRALGLEANS